MNEIKNKLAKKIWALAAYKNASQVMMHAQSSDELITGVCQGITRQAPFVAAWVGLKENNPEKSIIVAGAAGISKNYADGIRVSWDAHSPDGKGPTGQCVREAKSIHFADIETNPMFAPWLERAKRYNIRSSVGVPLSDGKEILGALMVYASEPNVFGEEEVSLFESLANEVGFVLSSFSRSELFESEQQKRNDLERKLKVSLEMTITALANTLESRDPYTAGHQNRVANIAAAIATELGWVEEKIYGLKQAALVHDIGKISVPIELLTKPTKLTELEKSLINEHAENGYHILKDIPFSTPVALTVRQHHERLDGSGYPNGLKGEEILIEARVLAVADCIEAMATNRPYRFAVGLDKAMAIIEADAGKKWDVDVISAVKRLHTKGILQALVAEKL